MRSRLEQFVAARTPAGPAVKIFRNSFLQLALALVGRRRQRRQLGCGRSSTRALPLAITPALLTTMLQSLGRRAISSGGPPALPVPGRFLARFTAIATQRIGWSKRPLTTLQQAAA